MQILALVTLVAAGVAGFVVARNFVRGRLRFVDGIYSPVAPWVAGILAALLAWPAALLPIITGTTALIFGLGVGMGTRSAVRALKRAGGEGAVVVYRR
jgi:hypothetical protein